MALIELIVGRTNIVVKPLNPEIISPILENICNRLTTYQLMYDPKTKHKYREKDKEYFTYNPTTNEYRFPYHAIKHIVVTLGQNNIKREDMSIKFIKSLPSVPLDLKWNDNITLRPYQEEYVNILLRDDLNTGVVDLQMGMGKAEWVENKIRTNQGWKRMGDIKVGDAVLTKSGNYTKVTGVYPRGVLPCYRVITWDKRMIYVSGDHLWEAKVGSVERVYTTEELFNFYTRNKNVNISLPLISPEVMDKRELPIPIEDLAMDIKSSLVKYKPEEVIVDPNSYFHGKTIEEIYIPEDYLNSSVEDRFKLASCLLGIKCKKTRPIDGEAYFISKVPLILKSITMLCWSLGWVCRRDPSSSLGYCLTIYTNSKKTNPNLRLKVIHIEKWEEDLECQCIKVEDESHLYVTEGYTLTHNTTIGMATLTRYNQRGLILVLPRYGEKWIEDIKKHTNCKDEEIYLAKGSESLSYLSNLTEEDNKYKFFILSMNTVTNYISQYENNKLDSNILPPNLLLEHLKIGIMLNDETHQHFHALYKAITYFGVNKLVCLTGTLLSSKRDIRYMQEIVFPKNARISNLVEKNIYINVKAIAYNIRTVKGVRYKTHRGYNQLLFEQSVLRNNLYLLGYLNMIYNLVEDYYMPMRLDNDKCLIFAGTIDMCSIITNYLSGKYPNLKVGRYTQSDPYHTLFESDIIVSTNGKASTGVDIPGLTVVINTISMASGQQNLQMAGRLRKIENREVYYLYTYCKQIPNQVALHNERYRVLKDTMKSYKFEEYTTLIKN